MTLREATVGQDYVVRAVETGDEELDGFLFSLGCYSGEEIAVISHFKANSIVRIKDGRYSIDRHLAEAITV